MAQNLNQGLQEVGIDMQRMKADPAYAQRQPQRFSQHAALWAETESAVQRVRARKLTVNSPRPALEWDNPGCDPRCQAQWEADAAKKLPLMISRETEVLKLRRAALQRQRAAVAHDIATAAQHLQATAYGLASRSQVHQGSITGYDGAVVAEIQGLLDRTLDAVRSAAVVPPFGTQVVLVPLAACR